MNFGESVKEEIFSKKIKEDHCKRAFLAGLVRGNGVLFESENGYGLSFKIAGEIRAYKSAELIREVFGFDVREMSVSEDRLNRRDLFEITVTGKDADRLLSELGILVDSDGGKAVAGFFGKLTERECCFRSFLRGLFVSAGSCTVPSGKDAAKTGYHAELCFSHAGSAELTAKELLKRGIKSNITRRKGDYVLYIKSAEEIKDFIGEHDFSAFCSTQDKKDNCVRVIFDATVEKDNNYALFTFKGNGFLKYMVRIMCGYLISVSLGKVEPGKIKKYFETKEN